MSCKDTSYDNRETCADLIPSSCVPYTGYISSTIIDDIPCRPNVNDLLKKLQELIDKINDSLGDNTTLTNECLSFEPKLVKQSELNQLFIKTLCELKEELSKVNPNPDPNLIKLATNILCLEDPLCTPKTEYSLQEILSKLIVAYCNLLERVKNIEVLLNI